MLMTHSHQLSVYTLRSLLTIAKTPAKTSRHTSELRRVCFLHCLSPQPSLHLYPLCHATIEKSLLHRNKALRIWRHLQPSEVSLSSFHRCQQQTDRNILSPIRLIVLWKSRLIVLIVLELWDNAIVRWWQVRFCVSVMTLDCLYCSKVILKWISFIDSCTYNFLSEAPFQGLESSPYGN